MPPSYQVASQRGGAFAAGAVALAVLYTGNNLPSALYGLFRTAFGFTPLVQTLIYVTAIAVILPCLVLFGPLSDVVGRRALMLVALAVFGGGDLLFATAHGVGWLFAARVAQGLGMGAGTAAAQAALTDAAVAARPDDPARAHRVAAITATACVTFGLALGPLLAGLLGQYAPAPRQLSFGVHLALVVIALLVATRAPGRGAAVGTRWRPARVGVPADVRRAFVIIGACSVLAWGVLGTFSAVLPSLVGQLLHTGNLAITAGALALMIATSGVVQLTTRWLPPLPAQAYGLALLAVGLVVLIVAGVVRGEALTVVAMLVTGAGHGLVYSGALRELTAVTPPAERGSVIGMYYLVGYVGLGSPVVAVGLLSLSDGLLGALRWVAGVIAVLCVVLLPLVFTEVRRPAPVRVGQLSTQDSP